MVSDVGICLLGCFFYFYQSAKNRSRFISNSPFGKYVVARVRYKVIRIYCKITVLGAPSFESAQGLGRCTFSGKRHAVYKPVKMRPETTQHRVKVAVFSHYCLLEREDGRVTRTVLQRREIYCAVFAGKYFRGFCNESAARMLFYIIKAAVFAGYYYCVAAVS